MVLAKRVYQRVGLEYEFQLKEFYLIYAGCLFISIKCVIDSHKWFVEDFSVVSQVTEKMVEKMEIFVLDLTLNFRVHVSPEELERERKKTMRNLEKRLQRIGKKSQ